MKRSALVLLLGLALGLAACGSVARVTPAEPGPSPAATPPGGQITDSDAGGVFSLHVGDRVELVLHQQPGYTQWANAQSSNQSVLVGTVDVRAAAARGVTLAMFKAISPGRADISATSGIDCSPGMACAALARVWKATIQVT